MPGQRQPGSWGLEPHLPSIDDGTSCRIPTPPPGSIGVIPLSNTRRAVTPNSGDRIDDLKKAVADFERSESWSALRPAVGPLLGQYSFGLGVVYGIGENVVTSVVELLQLVKTFLLADLYDRAQQPVWSAASLN